jgi:hypothetical protein
MIADVGKTESPLRRSAANCKAVVGGEPQTDRTGHRIETAVPARQRTGRKRDRAPGPARNGAKRNEGSAGRTNPRRRVRKTGMAGVTGAPANNLPSI